MSVLGNSEEAIRFLENLNETRLVDLYADLLALKGHTSIKITDGPGDGQRDIHSIDRNGEKCLTQSKFHGDPSYTVSSKELGEVVVGMVKFGYKQGCFLTNARLSPQAKRECIDNYPGYTVEFIDGRQLIQEVFGNLVLKAIWFDGEALNVVSYVLVVPIVTRDLGSDRPLRLFSESRDYHAGNVLKVGRTEVQVKFQRARISTSVFEPYRLPRVRTMSEYGSSKSYITEGVLSGIIHLEDTEDLLVELGAEVLGHIQSLYGPTKQLIAARLGVPYLMPLGGEASGARIELDQYSPFTSIKHNGAIYRELDWICPSQNSGWYLPRGVGGANSQWACWYNPELDTCLDVFVVTPPSESGRWEVEDHYEYFVKWWKDSLFMLLPSSLQRHWLEFKLPEPTHSYYWREKEILCCWLHPNLRLPMRVALPDDDERPGEQEQDSFSFVDLEKAKKELDEIKDRFISLGGVVVDPLQARHMMAILDGADPFPQTEMMEYGSWSLMLDEYHGYRVIPSPIDPASRGLQFTCCWLLGETRSGTTRWSEHDAEEIIGELQKLQRHPFLMSLSFDDSTADKNLYLLVDLEYEGPIGLVKTDNLLDDLKPALKSFLEDVEESLKSHFQKYYRATSRYWNDEIYMHFEEPSGIATSLC